MPGSDYKNLSRASSSVVGKIPRHRYSFSFVPSFPAAWLGSGDSGAKRTHPSRGAQKHLMTPSHVTSTSAPRPRRQLLGWNFRSLWSVFPQTLASQLSGLREALCDSLLPPCGHLPSAPSPDLATSVLRMDKPTVPERRGFLRYSEHTRQTGEGWPSAILPAPSLHGVVKLFLVQWKQTPRKESGTRTHLLRTLYILAIHSIAW